MSEFNQVLRNWRARAIDPETKKAPTQEKVAQVLFIDLSTYQRWETERLSPSPRYDRDTRNTLAEAFGAEEFLPPAKQKAPVKRPAAKQVQETGAFSLDSPEVPQPPRTILEWVNFVGVAALEDGYEGMIEDEAFLQGFKVASHCRIEWDFQAECLRREQVAESWISGQSERAKKLEEGDQIRKSLRKFLGRQLPPFPLSPDDPGTLGFLYVFRSLASSL